MRSLFTFAFLALCLVISHTAAAATIQKIVVEGNQRTEEGTVRSYMDIAEGQEFDQKQVNESLRKMFSTGLFSDVTVTEKNGVVTIKVVENPIINKVAFEGNKKINDEALTAEVSLQPRAVYTRAKVQSDTQKIQSMYRKSGRFSVNVEPKIEMLDQNRVNLVFEIDEGKKATIGKITFVGNKVYKDSDLLKVINTKPSRWYSFYSGNDTYDPDRVAYDKELLRKYYIANGYADFRVVSSTAEITKDKNSFLLSFTVEEGDRYTFGKMNVTSSLPSVKIAELQDVIQTEEGKIFDASQVDGTIEEMTTRLNDLGYAFVEITPEYDRDEEANIMGVTYAIAEGPKVYIDRINVSGNVRTLDKVVRREFRIAEGDPFNAAKIRRSQQRIQNLGFFEKVDVDSERTDVEDKANINVNVTEKSTGELSFGAGYSTHDGALGNVSVQERNLLGRGQNLRVSLQKSQVGLTSELSFTEPYFMDKDLAAGFDIWNTSSDRIDDAVSSTDSLGISFRGSYSLTEHLRHTLRYTVKKDTVTNISPLASSVVRSQAGSYITSMVGQSFLYDKRDNRFNPTEGYFILLDQRLAGLGGDLSYLRHEMNVGYYYPMHKKDFILKLTASGGHVVGYAGEDVRYADNFRLSGRVVRGFENIGFGPTDFTQNTIDPTVLGGKRYYAQTTELEFPIPFVPDEMGFTGFVFHDLGSVTGLDVAENPLILDPDALHASGGVGFSWVSPLGPLNVSYAIPYLKESYDKTQRVQFDFGTRF